jgi:signal transduction histidine kinase
VGTAAAVGLVDRVLRVPLAVRPLLGVLLGLAVYNTLVSVALRHLRRERETHAPERGVLLAGFALRVALAPVFLLMGALVLANWARTLGGSLSRTVGKPVRPRYTLATFLLPRAWWGLEHGWEVLQAAAFASAQITLDLVALALLLHFAGGITNPFAFFLVFHVVISSVLLSRRATYMQATIGFGLAAAVGLGELFGVLDHFPLAGLARGDQFRSPAFVGGQLFVLGTTLYLCAYMSGSIAARLRFRERDRLLLAEELAGKAAALEQAYARLSQTERAKSQYMRKVAHELRGPLGTIRTTLAVLRDGAAGPLPDSAHDLIERVERRAGELSQVTADLLELTRAREGRLGVELDDVDLAAVVAEVVEDCREPAAKAGVAISSSVGDGPSIVRGEATSLRQLVGNLVANAIRYTPRGGAVRVALAAAEGSLSLEVEDTGIGIPAEDLTRVFDEFYRSPNARGFNSEGTGLGLAIVRAAAEQHGGRVLVRSEVGKGTCFTVKLPAAPARL